MGIVIAASGAEGGGGGASETPDNIYISALNGDDANDGATPLTPIQTVSRLWGMFPANATIHRVIVVHWGSGTYTYVSPPKPILFSDDGGLVFEGDGAGQPGDDGFTVLATGTVTSTSSTGGVTLVTDAGAAWVPDEWTGKTLEITSGGNTGWKRSIVENTATDIEYMGRGFTSLLPGDTFRIVQSAVILENPAGGFSEPVILPGPLVFENMRITNVVSFASWQVSGAYVGAYGLEMDILSTAWFSVTRQTPLIAGHPYIPWFSRPGPLRYVLLKDPVDQEWRVQGWGVSSWEAPVSSINFFAFSDLALVGVVVGRYSPLPIARASYSEVLGRLEGLFNNIGIVTANIKTTKLAGSSGLTIVNSALVQMSGADQFPTRKTRLVTTKTNNQIRAAKMFVGFIGMDITIPSLLLLDNAEIVVNSDGPLTITFTSGSFSITQRSKVSGRVIIAASPGTLQITEDSCLELNGFAAGAITATGGVQVLNGSTLILNNTSAPNTTTAGSLLVTGGSRVVARNPITLTGGLTVQDNASFLSSAALVAPNVNVFDNSALTLTAGATTITSTSGPSIQVLGGSSFVQRGTSTLTISTTANPDSIRSQVHSRVTLLGGASLSTTHAVLSTHGSSVSFNSNPTGVGSAVAGAELKIGNLAAQSKALLTGANTFITDAAAAGSVGTGGWAVIGRIS